MPCFSFSYKFVSNGPDVFNLALLSTFDIAVAAECDVVGVYLVDSVKDVLAFCNFCQYNIANFGFVNA